MVLFEYLLDTLPPPQHCFGICWLPKTPMVFEVEDHESTSILPREACVRVKIYYKNVSVLK